MNKTSLSLQLDDRLVKQSLICTNNFTKLSTEVDLRDYCSFPLTASYVVKKTLPFYMTFLTSLFIIARFPELRAPALLSCLPITFAQDEALIQTPATNYMLVYVLIFMLLKVKKSYLWIILICLIHLTDANDAETNQVYGLYGENLELNYSMSTFRYASWNRVYGPDDIDRFGFFTPTEIEKVFERKPPNHILNCNLSLIIKNATSKDAGIYFLTVLTSSGEKSIFFNVSLYEKIDNFELNITRVYYSKHWCQVSAFCKPKDDRPYKSTFTWQSQQKNDNYIVVSLNTSDHHNQLLQCQCKTPVQNLYTEVNINHLCSPRNNLLVSKNEWLPIFIVAPIAFLITGILLICICCKFNTKFTLYALLLNKGADALALNATTAANSTYQDFIAIFAVLTGISFFLGLIHVILWCLFKFYKK